MKKHSRPPLYKLILAMYLTLALVLNGNWTATAVAVAELQQASQSEVAADQAEPQEAGWEEEDSSAPVEEAPSSQVEEATVSDLAVEAEPSTVASDPVSDGEELGSAADDTSETEGGQSAATATASGDDADSQATVQGGGDIVTEDDAEAEDEGETPDPSMPAQGLSGSANLVTVSVNAPQGALPAGTSMIVGSASASGKLDIIGEAASGPVAFARAIDITFIDGEGNPVVPARAVEVTLKLSDAPSQPDGVVRLHDGIATRIADEGDVNGMSVTFSSSNVSHIAIYSLASAEVGSSDQAVDAVSQAEAETVPVTVTVAWADEDDVDGIRPDSASVYLYAGDRRVDGPVVLSDENDWSCLWDVQAASDGEKIDYQVVEVPVYGYESVVSGSVDDGFVITNTRMHQLPAQSFDGSADQIAVHVEAPEGAFPEGTTMAVTPADSEGSLAAVEEAIGGDIESARIIDITFSDKDGKEIQPLVPVEVTFSVSGMQDDLEYSVLHITDDAVEQVANPDGFDGENVSFEAESFSPYVVLAKAAGEGEYSVRVGGQRMACQDGNRDVSPSSMRDQASLQQTVTISGGTTATDALADVEFGFDAGQAFESLGWSSASTGEVFVAQRVVNRYSGETWICVGFVPVSPLPDYYGLKSNYVFHSASAAQSAFGSSMIPYGSVPTEEQLAAIDSTNKIAVVWCVPERVLTRYKYDGEPIDDATPIEWTTTTDGVTCTISVEEASWTNDWRATVTYSVVIPEGIDVDDIDIDLLGFPYEALVEQPGDFIDRIIIVTDESGNKYEYVTDSGAYGTYINPQDTGTDSLGIGFERYNIATPGEWSTGLSQIYRRSWSQPIKALFFDAFAVRQSIEDGDLRSDINYLYRAYNYYDYVAPEDEFVGAALKALGYGNPADDYETIARECLDDYYLDWANSVANMGKESPTQVYGSFRDIDADMFGAMFISINSYSESDWPGFVNETNPIVANGAYYGFYEMMYPVNPLVGSMYTDHGWFGAYTSMHGDVNAFAGIFADQWASSADGNTHTLQLSNYIHHKNGNAMQDTFFGTSAQFRLRRPRVDVTVEKVWSDSDDTDGIRPDSVVVELVENGEPTGRTATLSADNDWTYTWEGLLKYKNDEEVTYTVREVDVPDGYTVSVSGDAEGGFVVTNTHTPKKDEPPTPPDEPVTPPEKPQIPPVPSIVPKTGDPTSMLPAALLGLLGIVCVVAGVLGRRRRDDKR